MDLVGQSTRYPGNLTGGFRLVIFDIDSGRRLVWSRSWSLGRSRSQSVGRSRSRKVGGRKVERS